MRLPEKDNQLVLLPSASVGWAGPGNPSQSQREPDQALEVKSSAGFSLPSGSVFTS